MNNTEEIQNKKINARLYPIYKMLSWDLLFYYSIIFLYLVQAKNFSASQVMLGEAFFTASCFVLQIPIGLLVDKIGKKRSLVIANICMCLFSFILLIIQNFNQLLIGYFIDAIGYVLRTVCETNILYDSLPIGKRRGNLYSEIDGIGASRYYVVDAITSLIAGYAFVLNPYLPIIFCFIANIISTILATRFRSIKLQNEQVEVKEGVREYFRQLGEAIRFTKKSKRIFCLLLYFGLVSGLIYNLTTFRSSVLEGISIPEHYFGIIFAISQMVAAICAKAQIFIHKRFRNKTLAVLGIPLTISCIIIGFLAMIGTSTTFKVIIVLLFVFQGAIKGAYNVLIYRYLNNFTNRKIRTKLATIRNMFYNISSILISLFGAMLLNYTDSANTIIIVGCMMTILIILLLDYMRGKVGLKPEQYKKEDLKYMPKK